VSGSCEYGDKLSGATELVSYRHTMIWNKEWTGNKENDTQHMQRHES
jgi:hypothetical protein